MIFYAKSKLDELIAKLDFSNKLELSKFLLANKEYKGSWIVTVEKEKVKRTLDQNAFYWMYLEVIEKETGNLASDLHELFKRKFLEPIQKKIMNVEFKLPASTSDLSKADFSDYMDKIAAFTEVSIPEPIKKEFKIESVYENLEVPEGKPLF